MGDARDAVGWTESYWRSCIEIDGETSSVFQRFLELDICPCYTFVDVGELIACHVTGGDELHLAGLFRFANAVGFHVISVTLCIEVASKVNRCDQVDPHSVLVISAGDGHLGASKWSCV